MIFNMTGVGSGGIELNLQVVAYASESAMNAASPSENTIGVVTTTSIPNWTFSATEPASPTAGDVWIKTSDTNAMSINALKKNGIFVRPNFSYQYINGSWVAVTSKLYQNGSWLEWAKYFFKSGSPQTVSWSSYCDSTNGRIVITDECIDISYSDPNYAYGRAYTVDLQDLSSYNTLYFDMVVTSHYNMYGGTAKVGVTSTAGSGTFICNVTPTVDGVRRVVSLSINGVNSGHIGTYGIMNAKIYNIWAK